MTTTVQPPILAESAPDAALVRVVRGVVGGELAGAVFALATMWYVTGQGLEAKAPLLMMSTMTAGRDSMTSGSTSVAAGVLVHLTLSAMFGVLFALLVPRFRTNGTLLLAGVVYGGVVYVVNFRLISPPFFPAFQDANPSFELLVHLLYGFVLSLIFLSRGVRRGEPRLAWR